jgi:hypothetical protein
VAHQQQQQQSGSLENTPPLCAVAPPLPTLPPLSSVLGAPDIATRVRWTLVSRAHTLTQKEKETNCFFNFPIFFFKFSKIFFISESFREKKN